MDVRFQSDIVLPVVSDWTEYEAYLFYCLTTLKIRLVFGVKTRLHHKCRDSPHGILYVLLVAYFINVLTFK